LAEAASMQLPSNRFKISDLGDVMEYPGMRRKPRLAEGSRFQQLPAKRRQV
jgi:hypothetical protein